MPGSRANHDGTRLGRQGFWWLEIKETEFLENSDFPYSSFASSLGRDIKTHVFEHLVWHYA